METSVSFRVLGVGGAKNISHALGWDYSTSTSFEIKSMRSADVKLDLILRVPRTAACITYPRLVGMKEWKSKWKLPLRVI